MNLPNKGPIHQSVAVLANQIGKMDFNDGVLRWALSALTGIMILIVVENKDVLVWGLLPLMYANSTWNLCFYSSSKYLGQYDGMANNAHCLLYGFSKIMPLIINLIERDDSELHQAYKSLWKMASKFLVSGWITFSDPEFHSESARSLIISLHKVMIYIYVACTFNKCFINGRSTGNPSIFAIKNVSSTRKSIYFAKKCRDCKQR
jgi:hypothetical protein